ncbi:SPOR domain-containing protein [Parahaliea aestuarii]|uniref:SPOR domain-containing protein n=1 Tax=Parahaliea aestuarii TaxID=1852021 RepID=A0A5C8ZXA5_9GAMM|nr:SPOR domain-containing protein [Parahaliea aestuarii]TXS92394.1 hypothetical protein FVW59_08200 [Parahaliea aestuarii]
MSNHSDNGNPFSPSRRPQSDSEADDALDNLIPDDEDDEYALDYRSGEDNYDPDEILDDVEEPAAGVAWPDPADGMSATAHRPADDSPDDLFDNDDSDPRFDDDDDDGASYPSRADDRDDDDDEEWDDYEDDDERGEEDDDERGLLGPWPLGLIAAGVVALLLLAVGGFGVLQERAALREEIRELRAELAVAVNPDQLSQERSTQRDLVERNESLAASLDSLRLENRQLSDTVAGLERQLEVQQAAARQASEKAAQAKPAARPATKPAATKAPASSASGDWFVNFGSYRQRELADSWARRLQPAAGKVVVQAAPGGDLYRVRIISLPDKATAQSVASALQSRYNLSELWVGED